MPSMPFNFLCFVTRRTELLDNLENCFYKPFAWNVAPVVKS